MPPRVTPTNSRRTTAAPPTLERFYGLKQATARLGISDPDDPDDKSGQKWLRDGVNLDGWDCYRMSGRLVFSESQLAEIAAKHLNLPDKRAGRSGQRGKPGPRKRTSPKPTVRESQETADETHCELALAG